MSSITEFEAIYELIREEVKKAVGDAKKSDPKLEKEIEALFSLSLNFETITATLLRLVMNYAEHPGRARNIIPSLQATTRDIITTKNNYERAKKFPHLYPYNLSALRLQFSGLKQLWNTKVSKLILDVKLSTKVEASVWSAIAQQQELGGMSI